jgi:pimeloyl-ACP methyl ester carboxylesterase
VADPVFGGRLYLLQVGPNAPASDKRAPPLVLVHGLGDAGVRDFYSLLPGLAKHRRVIAFDLPGFARSTSAGPPYEPERYADLLAHVISVYANGRADVLGHSMGGAIALEHSARHPEQVRRLVLIDAAGILHRDALVAHGIDASIMGPVQNAVRERLSQLPAPARFTDGVADQVGGTGRALLSAVRRFRPPHELLTALAPADAPTRAALVLVDHDFAPALDASRAPTLVVWGRDDMVAPLRVGQLLAYRLPEAQLVVLDGVGHVPPTEAPRRTLQAVLSHLDRPDAPASADAAVTAVQAVPDAAAAPLESVHCTEQMDFRLSGTFDQITLDRCPRAQLDGVTARRLVVRSSSVTGVSVRIDDGISAEDSEVTLTGGSVGGYVALEAAESVLDLAGIELTAERPVHVVRASNFLMSVCSVRAGEKVRYLHGMFALRAGQTFPAPKASRE